MDFLFNNSQSPDTVNKNDLLLIYHKSIYKGNTAFGTDAQDYSDHQWYGEDSQQPTNNDTSTSSGEDDTGFNCSDYLNFMFEMNKFNSPSQIVVPAIYCMICLVGLIGNGLVMFVIFGSKEMTKTVANIYIWNLALADTLFLVSLPFSSTQRILLSWPFGSGMCKLVEAVKYLNYFASVFFLTAMSVDRYIAVVYVVPSSKWRTSRNTFFICAIIWVVSLVMVIPLLINTQVQEGMCALVFNTQENISGYFGDEKGFDEKALDWIGLEYSDYGDDCDKLSYFFDYTNVESIANGGQSGASEDFDYKSFLDVLKEETQNSTEETTLCKHPDSKTFHIFLIFTSVIGFLIPFIIITICYILIVARLVRHSERRNRSKQAERTRRKVTRMVVALVITFFTCWLPFYVWHLLQIKGVRANIGVCHNIRDFTFCLGYANSCLNPLLYTFLGHNFQERLRKSIAISLRSFSFTTFTKYTNTVSRAETGVLSRAKMEASQSEHYHQARSPAKAAHPLYRVKNEDKVSVSAPSTANGSTNRLLD